MYEFLVLSQLGRSPRHGYLIAKVIENIMGPFHRAHWGTLYPVLNRLLQEGLIEEVEGMEPTEGRPRKVYAITKAGRQRLHEHLMDTSRHQGEYDRVFAHKVACFSLLTPDERIYLARHYTVYAQQNIDHLRECRDELPEKARGHLTSRQVLDTSSVMGHRMAYWEAERAWAESLILEQQHAPAMEVV
ncbi:MAG: PadR family transcriptional regulator [Chloroflexota bacterium]|nr:PadR family transcriptional regulator [Chloroflexota bacterium]